MQQLFETRRLFINPEIAPTIVFRTLERFGHSILRRAFEHGIRITLLDYQQSYRSSSPTLRRLAIDVDSWPTPPAGLFVVEERAMLIRRPSAMTIAHEFGHAIDCTLGGGLYRSASDARLQDAFASAKQWITPYAATRIDEYFAEGLRAYIEANDSLSPWPRVSREKLARCDPKLFAYVDELFKHDFLCT